MRPTATAKQNPSPMPTPEDERRMLEILKRMGDKLLQLGYADAIMFQDVPQIVTIRWNPTGRVMKRELQRIFDAASKGGTEVDINEIKALLILFLSTKEDEQGGVRGR